MVSEAVLVQQLEDRCLEVTVDDADHISKGTILKLSDANLGTASSADGDIFLGIAKSEKVANDGQVRLAVWRHGVFDIYVEAGDIGGVSAGEMVKISGANFIVTADSDTIETHGEVVGMALQDGAVDEQIEVLVGGW